MPARIMERGRRIVQTFRSLFINRKILFLVHAARTKAFGMSARIQIDNALQKIAWKYSHENPAFRIRSWIKRHRWHISGWTALAAILFWFGILIYQGAKPSQTSPHIAEQTPPTEEYPQNDNIFYLNNLQQKKIPLPR